MPPGRFVRADEGRDPPAGEGRARDVAGSQRAEQKGGDPTRLGGELQAPALGQAEPVDLGQGGGEAGMAERLLERPEPGGAGPGPDHDQTRRVETEDGQAGGMKIVARTDPEHGATGGQPAEKGQRETGRRPVIGGAAQLVQATARQTTTRQGPIDRRHAQGQDRPAAAPRAAFQPGEPGPQALEKRPSAGGIFPSGKLGGCGRHDPASDVRLMFLNVLYLFYSPVIPLSSRTGAV